MRVVLAGAFDTKPDEYAFWADLLRGSGHEPVLVDVGTRGRPGLVPAVRREVVAARAGLDLTRPADRSRPRAEVLAAMAEGLAQVVAELEAEAGMLGLAGMGGSGAVTLLGPAMRHLRLGSPRVLVTTMVETATAALAGTDAIVMPSVVDLAGLNGFTRSVLRRATALLDAQSQIAFPERSAKRIVAVTMFGVTTVAATAAREVLEAGGCEVLTFHANGAGGRSMESLIRAGAIDGVLDLTTTELADDLLGGKASAGPARLTAAAVRGVPQVVSTGALDMANFGPLAQIPPLVLQGRAHYAHGPDDTLVRTSVRDSDEIGARLGSRVRETTGPAVVLLPRQGVSALSEAGQPFHNDEAEVRLHTAVVRSLAGSAVPVEHVAAPLNSVKFGTQAAEELLKLMSSTLPTC